MEFNINWINVSNLIFVIYLFVINLLINQLNVIFMGKGCYSTTVHY